MTLSGPGKEISGPDTRVPKGVPIAKRSLRASGLTHFTNVAWWTPSGRMTEWWDGASGTCGRWVAQG